MIPWNIILPIVSSAGSLLVAYLVFLRNKSKDEKAVGVQEGMILKEIGYITSGIDDIKSEQREQRGVQMGFGERLAAVEASSKQAHHRIDGITGGRGER